MNICIEIEHCCRSQIADSNNIGTAARSTQNEYNVTCDEEFVALIRGATGLDFATVLEQQQQRTGRQAKWVDEHANEAEADESEVAVASATDLEVDIEPFLVLIELAAAKTLEDRLAHERVCNNFMTTSGMRQ